MKLTMNSIRVLGLFFLFALVSCKDEKKVTPDPLPQPNPDPVTEEPVVPAPEFADPNAASVLKLMVDKNATDETAALFYNLKMNSKEGILVGQQDAYLGFYSSSGTNDKISDMKLVTGKNPALLGLDFMFITDEENTGEPDNWWYQQETQIIDVAKKAYKRGSVLHFTWHYRGDHSDRTFYAEGYTEKQKQEVFRSILEGGEYHEAYKLKLQKIAEIADQLRDENGKLIPFIFRPFHEFDGDWFWWGRSYCTPAEYIQNYRFTVEYLRDELSVRNILYAFAPDNKFSNEAVYLERYPGNDYVDIVGFDNYGDYNNQGATGVDNAAKKLKIISDYAIKNNKVAALTETGFRVLKDQTLSPSDFYTDILLKSLKREKLELAFMMFWGNNADGYYVPAPGASGEENFVEFSEDPYTLFEEDIAGKMYKFPGQ